ncbi:MAG: Helix-turn-helix domain, partial [Pseudomonadota bacterium]
MKATKYRIKPTEEQQQKLAVQFGCARFVYNDAL